MSQKKDYILSHYYVYVHKDNYEQGETDFVQGWDGNDGDFHSLSFDTREELMHHIKQIVSSDTDFPGEVPDSHFFIETDAGETKIDITVPCKYVADESGRGYDRYSKATESDEEKWKKDELQLYAVGFTFVVNVYEPRVSAEFAKGGGISNGDTIYVTGKYRSDGSDFYEDQKTNDITYVIDDWLRYDRDLINIRMYMRFNDGTEREITLDDYAKGGSFEKEKGQMYTFPRYSKYKGMSFGDEADILYGGDEEVRHQEARDWMEEMEEKYSGVKFKTLSLDEWLSEYRGDISAKDHEDGYMLSYGKIYAKGGNIPNLKVTSIKYENRRRGLAYIAKTNIKGVEIVNKGEGGATYLDGSWEDIKPYNNLSEWDLEDLINGYEKVYAKGGKVSKQELINIIKPYIKNTHNEQDIKDLDTFSKKELLEIYSDLQEEYSDLKDFAKGGEIADFGYTEDDYRDLLLSERLYNNSYVPFKIYNYESDEFNKVLREKYDYVKDKDILNDIMDLELELMWLKSNLSNYAKGGKTDDNWIQDVTEDMEKDGTEGAFTKQAKRHKMTPIQFAKKVLKNPKKFSLKTRQRAQFVKNVNPEKFYEGGNISQVSKVGDPDYPNYEL